MSIPLDNLPPKLRAQALRIAASELRNAKDMPLKNAPKPRKRNITAYEWHPKCPFVCMCEDAGLPQPEEEYRFHPERKWRFDVAWPKHKIAVEIDGGLYVNGGHSRGAQREKDYEKDAHAMALGWRVLRVSTGQVKRGDALRWLLAIFFGHAANPNQP
jgi:hypothetical protein